MYLSVEDGEQLVGKKSPIFTEIPIDIVGSNTYGHYPKISLSSTYNMYISDDWLISFPGYAATAALAVEDFEGRALFNSSRCNCLIAVVSNNVYSIDKYLHANLIGTIDTTSGDVFIDENNKSQIAICDQRNIYIYDYANSTFTKAPISFIPNHIVFQDGYFISAHANQPIWELSALGNGMSWPGGPAQIGGFQSKADNVVACIRIPGKDHQLLVIGNIVTMHWTDVGYQLFPYKPSTGINIDYGCVSIDTISCGDSFVIWVGKNEKSGPIILLSDGTSFKQVSTDGINYQLSRLSHPEESYGFLYKQDGHLFYQVTFYNDADNITLLYDFSADKFYYLTDDKMNYHIAKKLEYFNDGYYFLSFNDGLLYSMGHDYTTFNGLAIPRKRILSPIRMPDNSGFIANNFTFTIEQGIGSSIQRVDLSVSRDGQEVFGNIVSKTLNSLGDRKNIFEWWGLGYANELTLQLDFCGLDRFVMSGGVMSIYQ